MVEQEELIKFHPCYNQFAHKYARMHIPVAPKCNVSCNYCNRKYDCLNESRPGVTSEVLLPKEALEKYLYVKEKIDNLKVVGIAGPGDALANFDAVRESIKLIKEVDKDVIFCISTNGLMLPEYVEEIVELGIKHVTITINSLDKSISGKIYKHVSYKGEMLTGEEAGEILLRNQLGGLEYLAQHGVLCKVNIVMIKGINEEHIPEVVKKVKSLGAFMTNIMPLIPAQGSVFEDMPLVSNVELNDMRKKCSIDLKQMYHCKQCRADAIGMLSDDRSIEFRNCGKGDSTAKLGCCGSEKDYIFAVASKTGKLIDQHFGHAEEFLIYKYDKDGIKFLEKRSVEKYCTGKEECEETEGKIEEMINMLDDCNAVISMRMGYEPKKKFQMKEIQTIELYDTVENAIKQAVNQLK